MGCTASRPDLDDQAVNDWHHPSHMTPSRSISMPATHPHDTSLHDFNIVPLSSSKYGINMKCADQEASKIIFGDAERFSSQKNESMKQMLLVLESLDMGNSDPTSEPPKKWPDDQVSSILEDLKPGLEKHFNEALGKPIKYSAESNLPLPAHAKAIRTTDEALNRGAPGFCMNTKPATVLSSSGNGKGEHQVPAGAESPARKNDAESRSLKSKPSFLSRFFRKSSSSSGRSTRSAEVSNLDNGCKSSTVEDMKSQAFHGAASGLLLDADFLASYEDALRELTQEDWKALKLGADKQEAAAIGGLLQAPKAAESKMEPQNPAAGAKEKMDPLEKFEKLCPPGGEKSVVLYTTSLRGIRKTFEDCNSLRDVMQSMQVFVDERDVAMHQGFRNELREMMGNKPVPVPRLFIKGHYIGGAEEVLQLHEEEQLLPLLHGLPRDQHGASAHPCDGCGGARFVPCLECSGSRKVVHPDNPRDVIRCPDCNENGLIQCPICS